MHVLYLIGIYYHFLLCFSVFLYICDDLYETCIQIKYKSSHIYCKEEIGVYAHYAYTPINYMKIEIILFYSVQIYKILYN